MSRIEDVEPGMEIIGADGVDVGTVDALDGSRIRLTKEAAWLIAPGASILVDC